jgi:hypothetical protein
VFCPNVVAKKSDENMQKHTLRETILPVASEKKIARRSRSRYASYLNFYAMQVQAASCTSLSLIRHGEGVNMQREDGKVSMSLRSDVQS